MLFVRATLTRAAEAKAAVDRPTAQSSALRALLELIVAPVELISLLRTALNTLALVLILVVVVIVLLVRSLLVLPCRRELALAAGELLGADLGLAADRRLARGRHLLLHLQVARRLRPALGLYRGIVLVIELNMRVAQVSSVLQQRPRKVLVRLVLHLVEFSVFGRLLRAVGVPVLVDQQVRVRGRIGSE